MESRSHLGELSRYLGELFHYLQDPHLVARFQRICGVHGTFSGPAGSSKVGQRTDLHTSGARCRHARVGKESAGSPFEGAGEGDNVRRTEPEVRKSSDTNLAEVHEEKYDVRPQNGCAATSGGQTVGAAGEGGSLRGATDGGRTRTGVADPPGSSTVKPRRKNSLTGDAGQEFVIENRFLYYLFSFGTELGNELFYIIFFPFLTWNLGAFVSRRLVMVWVWVMYLGQCTKDVIGWSRPASPPVVKVEMFYNSEYSMPSTHAMSGTAIPFALFFMTCSRWEYPDLLGFSLALCWCLLVCVSRIYMGMHSVLDVIVGVLYSALILLLFLPVLDRMDSFNLTCRYAPLVVVSLHLGLGLFSFTLDTWSTSRGDTAQILGVGVGVALASHLNHQLGLMPDPSPEQLPFAAPELSVRLAAVAALRLTVGVCVLLTTRALMKAVTIPLVCRVSGVSSGDIRKARQHMEVELPYRFIVYGTLGFSMQFLVPLLFRHMQLP